MNLFGSLQRLAGKRFNRSVGITFTVRAPDDSRLVSPRWPCVEDLSQAIPLGSNHGGDADEQFHPGRPQR